MNFRCTQNDDGFFPNQEVALPVKCLSAQHKSFSIDQEEYDT